MLRRLNIGRMVGKSGLTPNPSPRGEGSGMPCSKIAFLAYQLSSCIAFYAPLQRKSLTPSPSPKKKPHPQPLSKGERGVICLAVTLHFSLVSLVAASHITPLSPWRGVGGEASRGVFPFIYIFLFYIPAAFSPHFH